jgi:hypothetical protein
MDLGVVVLPGNRGLRHFYHQVAVRPAEGGPQISSRLINIHY